MKRTNELQQEQYKSLKKEISVYGYSLEDLKKSLQEIKSRIPKDDSQAEILKSRIIVYSKVIAEINKKKKASRNRKSTSK